MIVEHYFELVILTRGMQKAGHLEPERRETAVRSKERAIQKYARMAGDPVKREQSHGVIKRKTHREMPDVRRDATNRLDAAWHADISRVLPIDHSNPWAVERNGVASETHRT